ncbi:hypothetical protein [Bacillus sp. FJAT-45037]|uniref:hypothetical protein n=1 Tax=Bacillus sp. FJAT-45037 TaxID=2011007 RepID=UPI000C243CBA|nr:hypothetical protein [Bacillus sp. FJAT-45037]
MEANEFNVVPEKLVGKIVEDIAVTDLAVVIKLSDNTYLDIYLDHSVKKLKTSTNKLETKG